MQIGFWYFYLFMQRQEENRYTFITLKNYQLAKLVYVWYHIKKEVRDTQQVNYFLNFIFFVIGVFFRFLKDWL